jgi:uncharacterized protein YgiM (DUF1202 family)
MGLAQKPVPRRYRRAAISTIAALGLAACGDLAAALPPGPTPFPILERLPSVTPVTPRPTLPATATPITAGITPTPERPRVLVPANANMRSGPGVNFPIIAVVNAGSRIALSQRQGEWYEVRTANGQKGWMSNRVLEVDPAVAQGVPLALP